MDFPTGSGNYPFSRVTSADLCFIKSNEMLTMLIQGKTNNNNNKGRMFCYSYNLAMPWKSFCMHEWAGTVKKVSSLPPGPGSTAAGLVWNFQACSSTMQWKPWARRDVSCCLLQTNHQLSKSSAAHTGCNKHFLAPVCKHIDAFRHHTLKTKSALLLHDQMPFINLLEKSVAFLASCSKHNTISKVS